jgi:hypothetical protein
MMVRFYDKAGQVFDAREMSLVPRAGEGIILDTRNYYVGAVTHVIEGEEHSVNVTALEYEEARRFLGGNPA